MTYIEFFEKTVCENICSCLVNAPERVVLIGDKSKLLKKHAKHYHEVFLSKGKDIEFTYRSVNKNKIDDIIAVLENLVDTYDDCVFDLTGGDDLYLVAIGIISERFKDRHIQMHRFNILNGTVADCDNDGVTIKKEEAVLSVAENIKIYGGDIVYSDSKIKGTYAWNFTDSFLRDLSRIWTVCRCDVRKWNAQVGVLNAVECVGECDDQTLNTVAKRKTVDEYLSRFNAKFMCANSIVEQLKEFGLLSLRVTDDNISVTYKNKQVKKCLTTAGLILELTVYLAAKNAKDDEGNPFYNDVMHGVCIDWDGEIHNGDEKFDTENEIDVMLMHGVVPVFVSCKNGVVDSNELYKLNCVAERFGGKHAKKVLVTTALSSLESYEYIKQRAEDMGIKVFEDIQWLNEEAMEKTAKNFFLSD